MSKFIPTDYSKDENWMYKQTDAKHDVDLLYFYPTVTVKADNKLVCSITRQMKESAAYAFAETGSAFASYTNVFAPYYTQLPISINPKDLVEYGLDPTKVKTYFDLISNSQVKTDVFAALDYYFKHYNNNRPFMLAGHSQGSAVVQIILKEYMADKPDILKRMVAAYPIGFSVSKEYIEQNPHLKFAQGETDTNVIVSWNTEGPNATKPNCVLQANSLNINPLNWKTDGTPATADQNHGKLICNHTLHCWQIVPGTADATIDLKRGALINTTNHEYETLSAFGDKSLHTYDYAEYYVNIKENGLKRIEAYLNKKES